jgi:DNA invertase Pin-like site-specific DNA recombinase
MAAKQSQEARNFIEMIKSGMSVRKACAIAGITEGHGYRIKNELIKSGKIVKIVTDPTEPAKDSDNVGIVQHTPTGDNK